MTKADVVVLGGSAAGLTAALTARRHYPDKSVLIVRRERQVLIPCGIPYIFGTVGSPEKNLIPDTLLEKHDIDLLITNAVGIDRGRKVLETDDTDVGYDRLVIATGSLPAKLPVAGATKDCVFAAFKDVEYLRELQKCLQNSTDVVIIGGGFIGIEFADEIKKMGEKNVTIVETAPHCLSLAYDEEFCLEMEDVLARRGICVRTGVEVREIQGPDRVESVLLSNGETIKADVVILAIGAVPNVELARKAGLRMGPTGAIAVDRTMKTSDEHVFACGDCAEKTSFFGGRPSLLRLASIATTEARVAGANLFGSTRESIGTVGVWCTAVGEFALGTAGLTESMAREHGYRVICPSVEASNRHPGGMPGAVHTKVKLVFEADSGVILGGQVRGGDAAGELANAISACIQRRMTAEEIATFQVGTHPALTASPIAYPLVNAAEIAIGEMRRNKPVAQAGA